LAADRAVTAGTPVTGRESATEKINKNKDVTGVAGVTAVTAYQAPERLTGRDKAVTLGLQGDFGGFTNIDDISDFEERAAILEFDGGLSRPAAEAAARTQVAQIIPFRQRVAASTIDS
jgi:hypothetical protein